MVKSTNMRRIKPIGVLRQRCSRRTLQASIQVSVAQSQPRSHLKRFQW